MQRTAEVQVAAGSATAAELRSSDVGKPSGETACASRPAVSAADRVKKRSLLRARKRAAGDPMGLAWYRGRLMNSTQLGRISLNSSISNMQVACPSLPPKSKNQHRPRVQVATLNVGGFDQVTYDAFMQFLTSSACRYDVICGQEIHFGLGKASREWSAYGWRVITSVSTRFAGIAFFIRSSKWSAQEIRFRALVPGRLMHLRLDCKDFAFDVIGDYQHARPYMQQKGIGDILEQRAKIWAQLRNILSSLPKRNQLAVLGDMNTNLQAAKGIAGPGTFKPATPHKDQKELQLILQQFQLCALNTWSSAPAKLATNVGSEHDTQIDFILVRRQYADRVSRHSCPVPDLNFSPWRSGQRHLLVEATLPFFPGWRKHTPAIQPIDGAGLRNSVMGADEKCMMLRQKFQSFLDTCEHPCVKTLNTALLAIARELYPAQRQRKLLPAWAHESVRIAHSELQAKRAALLSQLLGLGWGSLSASSRDLSKLVNFFAQPDPQDKRPSRLEHFGCRPSCRKQKQPQGRVIYGNCTRSFVLWPPKTNTFECRFTMNQVNY